jgi:hypothetical protein
MRIEKDNLKDWMNGIARLVLSIMDSMTVRQFDI